MKMVASKVLGLLTIAICLAGGCISPDWVAGTLLEPGTKRGLPGETPAKHGLKYDSFEVEAKDGIRIHGWLMRQEKPTNATIIVCHGLGDSRAGALGLAVDLYRRTSANVAIFDWRRHGQSDMAPFTYGHFEKGDLIAVIDHLFTVLKTPRVAVVGWSAGAAIAIQTAAADQRILGLVAINSFASLRSAAYYRAPFFVSKSKVDKGLAMAETKAKFRVDDVSPATAISKIKVPVLLIVGDDDDTIDPKDSRQLKKASKTATLWTLEGYGHNDWWRHKQFHQRVAEFLKQSLVSSAMSFTSGGAAWAVGIPRVTGPSLV